MTSQNVTHWSWIHVPKATGSDLNAYIGDLAGAFAAFKLENKRLDEERARVKQDFVAALKLARERNVPWKEMGKACAEDGNPKPRQLLDQIIRGIR